LQAISLRGAPIGDPGLELLLAAPALVSAHYLGIERCGITDRGVENLAKSPQVRCLRELSLCNRAGIETGPLNVIHDEGALELAASPNLSQLQKLHLWNVEVGNQGFEALVASPYLAQLSSITAWGTRLTRAGLERVKAAAAEEWERRRVTDPGAINCWVHTDYDERVITYEE
jgi:hypothetical protein